MTKQFLIWLMSTKFYYNIIMKVIPYIRFSVYYTDLRGSEYNKAYRMLRPGDAVVAVDFNKATAVLVPGFTTHASFCVGRKIDRPMEFEMAEMTHHNFTKSDFFDICKEADRVLIVRCMDYTQDDISFFLQMVHSFKTALYDIKFDIELVNEEFELKIPMLYCSELGYQADKRGPNKWKVDLSDIHGLGRPYLSPDGILFGLNMKCIYDVGHEFEGLMGPEVEAKARSRGYIK